MTVLTVVEDLDEQDGALELYSGVPPMPVEQLGLQRGEEALHHGVIRRIANPAHAAGDAARFEVLAEAQRGVLAAFPELDMDAKRAVRLAATFVDQSDHRQQAGVVDISGDGSRCRQA